MTMSEEKPISIEAVRNTNFRDSYGVLSDLGTSIREECLRRPITLWSDGTLISGSRRLRSQFLLGGDFRTIPAVFVDTIEDAAKALTLDAQDGHLALPMKPSEICRLWELLRYLDQPAAARRATEARRRGVELRRATQSGKRKPGRSSNRSEDYALTVMAAPFQMSEQTAKRLYTIYRRATDDAYSVQGRELARAALARLDAGESSIWAEYAALVGGKTPPRPSTPRPVIVADPAPAAKQLASWGRGMPQLEGITAGFLELGPVNPSLTWEQVAPFHTRLMAVRRDLEKMINSMKGIKA
jgi:hypothetical protein